MDKNSQIHNQQSQADPAIERPRRLRALKRAHAAFNTEFSAVPCVVKNHNESGALLEFIDPVLVPERFVLHIEIDGEKIDVERRWQKGRQVGVQFVSEKRHTEIGRDQVVQPSENKLLTAQERAAEMRRKLDEARHQGILLQTQLEQPVLEEEEPEAIQQTSSDPVENSFGNTADQQSTGGMTRQGGSSSAATGAGSSEAKPQADKPKVAKFMPAAPPSYSAVPPQPPQSTAPTQPISDEAPLTGRIPVQERRSGLDRRQNLRATFGRRPADKKPNS